jgi:putative transposase
VSAGQDRQADRRLQAQEVGLFRYGLIADALDPALSTKQRGRLVREIAGREHAGPMWTPTWVSRASLDRWIRA